MRELSHYVASGLESAALPLFESLLAEQGGQVLDRIGGHLLVATTPAAAAYLLDRLPGLRLAPERFYPPA